MPTFPLLLQQRRPRAWLSAAPIALVAIVVAVTCLVCAGSVAGATAQMTVRDVYYTSCGLEGKLGKCELRTMTESLTGSQPVSTLPTWYAECGPNAGYPSTTVSENGTTAVTLEDTSKAPGTFGDTPICRLVVTNLSTGESHVLPAYSPKLLASIKASGWTVSPDGQYIAINGDKGVYVQDVQAATPPKLLRTGFRSQGVGWYPESARLLIDGPSTPGGGRGPADTANRLFVFTLAGHVLGRWLIKPVSTYGFASPFIQVGMNGQVYVGAEASLLPGAKPNMPSGYYLLRLGKHVSAQLITRVSQVHYGGSVSSFGVDSESGLIFFTNDVHKICSAAIGRGTRRCVDTHGSTAIGGTSVSIPREVVVRR
jgi:hypothetical protein